MKALWNIRVGSEIKPYITSALKSRDDVINDLYQSLKVPFVLLNRVRFVR